MIDSTKPTGKFNFWWWIFGVLSFALAVLLGIAASKKLMREDTFDAAGNMISTTKYKFIFQYHDGTKMNLHPAATTAPTPNANPGS